MSVRKFEGFPPGKTRTIQVPALFFSELLPLIDDLAELKVTLFCWWALHQKEGDFRYLRLRDFTRVESLMQGLADTDSDMPAETALNDALQRAVERGTLLCTDVTLNAQNERLFFMNTVLGRYAVQQLKAGNWKPSENQDDIEILPERPNAFALYEANIGQLTPLIVDEIKDALNDYPEHWIHEAIQLAVENNARRWRYIRTVLERWQKEGRTREIAGQDDEQDGQRYIRGRYSDFINH
jgi:DnaD/phage-associated family protein